MMKQFVIDKMNSDLYAKYDNKTSSSLCSIDNLFNNNLFSPGKANYYISNFLFHNNQYKTIDSRTLSDYMHIFGSSGIIKFLNEYLMVMFNHTKELVIQNHNCFL